MKKTKKLSSALLKDMRPSCRSMHAERRVIFQDMASAVLQVLGTAGIVESVVEFAYAIMNSENFTPFESVFFSVSGGAEILGEATLLFFMVRRMLKKDSAGSACRVGRHYLRDPIHIWCFSPWWEEEGYDFDLEDNAVRALILSLMPTLFWWVVLAILTLGMGFQSDGDFNVMLILSSVSLCFFVSFSASLCFSLLDYPNGYPVYASLYAVPKVFEVYLLETRRERLIMSDGGKLGLPLLILQLLGLLSCLLVVGKFAVTRCHYFERAKTSPGNEIMSPV